MKRGPYTLSHYQRLPEGADVELIEGQLVAEPSPTYRHQEVVARLHHLIYEHIWRQRGPGRVWADLDVLLDKHTVLRPDISYVTRERLSIGPGGHLTRAPDLVIEVLSPATAQRDEEQKRQLYHQYGVREYWLVNPEARTVRVVRFTRGGEDVYGPGQRVWSDVLQGAFEVDAIFFAWPDEAEGEPQGAVGGE